MGSVYVNRPATLDDLKQEVSDYLQAVPHETYRKVGQNFGVRINASLYLSMSATKEPHASFCLVCLLSAVLFRGHCCHGEHNHAQHLAPQPGETVTLGRDERGQGNHSHDAHGHGDNPIDGTELPDNGHLQTLPSLVDSDRDSHFVAIAVHGNHSQNESHEDGSLHNNTSYEHIHPHSDEEDIHTEHDHNHSRQAPHHGNHPHHHHNGAHGHHHSFPQHDYQTIDTPYIGRATTLALHEHRRYLRLLFTRYGSEDRLSLKGLQKLLSSLSLISQTQHLHEHHQRHGSNRIHAHHHHHGAHMLHQEIEVAANELSPDGISVAAAATATPSTFPLETTNTLPVTSQHTPTTTTSRQAERRRRKRGALNDAVAPSSKSITVPNQCPTASQLLSSFGMPLERDLTADNFTFVCTALLYQVDSRACADHVTAVPSHKTRETDSKPPSPFAVWNFVMKCLSCSSTLCAAWGWGFLSITIISLLALIGVAIVPVMNQVFFKYLLTFLVALAVGTLSGDALMHLLPHAQGGHNHNDHFGHCHGSSESHDSSESHNDGVWKGLTALMGVYLMFIIEHLLTLFKHYRSAKNKLKNANKSAEHIAGKLSTNMVNRTSEVELLAIKPFDEQNNSTGDGLAYSPLGPSNGGHCSTKLGQAPQEEAMITAGSGVDDRAELADEGSHTIEGTGSGLAVAPTIAQEKGHHHLHHNHHHLNHHHSHGHCHGEEEAVEGVKEAGVSSIAWMVILGDGVHNLSDGLAIGAAFTIGFGSGLSTSIAVFCHELPHELGDFAVLLKAGMTVRQAIVYNLLSASLGYLGMIIGTAVGQYTHTVTLWIFAITAGMFLYVALVDMLPEMLHFEVCSHIYGRLGCFLLQNLGLLVGFAAMLLIALYEESILVSIRC
uniref:zinc transporter ZIP6-like n=1 Tax=Myxine glutinosa TaxID=7769 RepID=UPI00358F90CE